jgi:hypothetical protein
VSFIDDIFNFFTNLSGVLDRIDTTVQDGEVLVANVAREIRLIKQFKFEPKWKTRVVLVPDAVNKTRSLIVDTSQTIHDSLHSLMSNLKAVRAASKGIVRDPSGSKQGVGAVLGIITEINNFVNEIDQGIKALNDFVVALQNITEAFRGLDTLFLQQGNSRLLLKDSTPRIRVGALHPDSG